MKKRSIEKDIEAFCGWKFLLKFVEKAPSIQQKGIISGLFLTGCRVSEFIQLRKNQFKTLNDMGIILVEGVPVIKRYSRKTGEKYKAYRTFPINPSEPLVPYLMDYLTVAPTKPFGYSRVSIYYIIRRIGENLKGNVPFSKIRCSELYPHWFRAQRARQLRHDYHFTDEELRDWFGWKISESGMPAIYGKNSWIELAEKMGIEIGYY